MYDICIDIFYIQCSMCIGIYKCHRGYYHIHIYAAVTHDEVNEAVRNEASEHSYRIVQYINIEWYIQALDYPRL